MSGMEKKVLLTCGGVRRELPFERPVRIAELLNRHRLPLDLPCGGRGICRRCRVTARGALSPLTDEERESLSPEEIQRGVRLACLAVVEGAAWIEAPDGTAMEVIEAAGEMPEYPLDPPAGEYGAAIDIGTTTLVASLYRLGEREPRGTLCRKNPQAAFGADVISRIGRALEGEGGALADAVSGALDGMLRTLAARCGIPAGAVSAAVAAGNTTMLYLLARESPEPLSHSPFTLTRPFGETLPAAALGLPFLGETPVRLPRCLSAFVGADITCAVLAGELTTREGNTLLADIGTNGEIALSSGGRLFACSTAAGPAFEGGGVRMGMNAARGAIDGVSLEDGEIRCTVLGGADTAPAGLCGSGLIDAAAVLLKAGVIDETGAIRGEGHPFAGRVTTLEGEPAVRLAGPVLLTQGDIRKVQLAKSAICAGIRTLVSRAGLTLDQVDRLLIAGGFGRHIRLENAGAIGLIPPPLCAKARAVGNAAVAGAALLLQNRGYEALTAAFAEKAVTVDLAADPLFMDYYVEGMLFP
ncbi:MAG TPA: DUF4445 domain-containing protein [Firmicutes bacterium]|nr:DUF4445 domain-containing protein [Bacillota bacterium]